MYDQSISDFLSSIAFIDGITIKSKMIYSIIMSNFLRGDIYKDYRGIYVNLSRKYIGNELNMCTHTVAKYIKELQKEGFIQDIRRGVTENNKIYLTDRISLAFVCMVNRIHSV